ncbi:MEF2-activating motif and SAP domain-containing transcriptional regulator [Vulpes lagopus]
MLQLRIHRRYQDPSLSGSFTTSPVLDPDPWVSTTGPALAPRAPAPVSPSGLTPFLLSPGDLLPESEYGTWRSLKISQDLPTLEKAQGKGELDISPVHTPRAETRVQGRPPGQRVGPGSPWTTSVGRDKLTAATSQELASSETQGSGPSPSFSQAPAAMKPTALTPSPPGVPRPSPPPHKLELQTLKLEELTVSELRQQLRLQGLPVSGTKSMLLERMRGGALPRERPKPRREDGPVDAPWPRLRPKALGAVRRQGSAQAEPKFLRSASCTYRGKPCDYFSGSGSGSGSRSRCGCGCGCGSGTDPFLSTGRSGPDTGGGAAGSHPPGALLPNRGIDDILEDQVEPEDPLPPIPLDFPGSFDVLSPSPDSEGLSSVFSSSLPSPTNSPSLSPRGPTDSLDWLEALSGGPLLGCGPPAPSIFSADLSDSSGKRLWDLLEDPW